MNKKGILTSIIVCVFHLYAGAQPANTLVRVTVAPDHGDWTYAPSEPIKFSVQVQKDNGLLKNVWIKYEVGPEKMEPTKRDSLQLPTGTYSIPATSMKSAGFIQCIVTAYYEGKEYRGLATAGIAPETIKPTVVTPGDFIAFWDKAKSDLAKIPLDSRMTLIPERSTEAVNVYHVNIQNYPAGARVYGILFVPKKDGKYPALLRVPGAGIRPYLSDIPSGIANAEKGIITLSIGIHGIPVNLDASIYENLSSGALNGYPAFNLENKDRYYYKRVYLGCVRANDFLTSLPQYDGTSLGIMGASQGGALSIVTASLDARIKYLGAYYPALSDMTGYLHNRAGGWPHLFIKDKAGVHDSKEEIETVGYYDVVNFARQLKIPGWYSWGFNDETCPPTSMYAVYNVIPAPKTLHLARESGHWTFPEQREMMLNWMVEKLKGK